MSGKSEYAFWAWLGAVIVRNNTGNIDEVIKQLGALADDCLKLEKLAKIAEKEEPEGELQKDFEAVLSKVQKGLVNSAWANLLVVSKEASELVEKHKVRRPKDGNQVN